MISWGSFIVGGLVCGVFAFVCGVAVGSNGFNESSIKDILRKAIDRLGTNETISWTQTVSRYNIDPDGCSDDGPKAVPLPPPSAPEYVDPDKQQNWRDQ